MKPQATPKDVFMWLGAMISLYWSVIAFILLIFNYIDYAFPNPLSYLSDPYSGGIPYEMASIIVLFPIYIALIMLIRHDIRADASRKDVWVRRWGIILTLFIAGASMVVDIIMLLTAFFRGEELTIAFLLKVAIVFLVGAVGFMHFTADLKGYWDANKKKERLAAGAFGILALVTVFSGFLIVGTPAAARLARFDTQKVSDLQNIQWQVVNYWQAKGKLPTALANLSDPISGFVVPIDPQTGLPYTYESVGAVSFKLCAHFNAEAQSVSQYGRPAMPAPMPVGTSKDITADTWEHGSGETCYLRTIDPDRYPPVKK